MKRFYKNAAAAQNDNGFAILLDGKSVKTPAGNSLVVVSQPLAEAIAAEWQKQGEVVQPDSMPLMKMAATCIDHVPQQREAMHGRLMAYIHTDLLCLREEKPSPLHQLQNKEWQPPLDWLNHTHGIALLVGHGLKGPKQPEFSVRALAQKLTALDDWNFIGVHEAASVSSSLVLALAMQVGALDAHRVFELAELESLYQAQHWGQDPVLESRHASIRTELAVLERWFRLIETQTS